MAVGYWVYGCGRGLANCPVSHSKQQSVLMENGEWGERCGDKCMVSVSGSEIARRFDSPMLSKIAAQKAAEHGSQAALASVARLNTSRAAGPALAVRSAGTEKLGLARNGPPGGMLRTAQTASSHTPNRYPKVSHSANTPRAARLITTFHGIKLVRGWS